MDKGVDVKNGKGFSILELQLLQVAAEEVAMESSLFSSHVMAPLFSCGENTLVVEARGLDPGAWKDSGLEA